MLVRSIVLTLAWIPFAALSGNAVTAAGLRAQAAAASAVTPDDCAAPAAACVPAACQPNIIYRTHGHRQVCCGCPAPIETVLVVKDPCGCTTASIPVCVPGCCTDVPQVCCSSGLFGRGVVRYDYACGFSIKIIFRLNGDIVVTYLT